MNSKFLLEKLKDSSEYKTFVKENEDAYLCSGFFVIDMENSANSQYHFDFFVPESKRTFSFELENGIKLVPLERIGEKVLEKVAMKDNFDFDEIEKIISREMEMKKIKNKIQKMIFSLQNVEGKDVLLGTIFVSGFGMIKANISLSEKKITEFEKKSFFDMMNIMRKK